MARTGARSLTILGRCDLSLGPGVGDLSAVGGVLMELYALIIEDRHCDVTVDIFTNRDVAIRSAKARAKEYCRFSEDYKEHTIAGWEFCAAYSCDGNRVRVVKTELNEEGS